MWSPRKWIGRPCTPLVTLPTHWHATGADASVPRAARAVRFGLTPAVNALATIMLTVTVLAVIVTAIVLRRSRVRAPGQDQTGGLDIAVGLR